MARNSILNSKAKKLKLLEIMVINSWIVRKSWIFQKSSNSYKNGRFFVKNYFHYIHKNSNSGRYYSRKIRQFRSKTRLFYSKNNTFFTQIYQICFHEMFRSKFWLNMTIFEKIPTKWQFWFEIGVFWRVGILGMVPDQIRKRNDLEWFRVRVEFRFLVEGNDHFRYYSR